MRLLKAKGITPVVALVLIIGVTISAAGAYYVVVQNLIQSQESDTDLSIESLKPVSCYQKQGFTHVSVKNVNSYPIESSRVTVIINKEITDLEPDSGKVDAGKVFYVNLSENYQGSNINVTLDFGEGEAGIKCSIEGGLVPRFEYTPQFPKSNQNVDFDASKSSSSEGTITQYSWDWDSDGNYEDAGKTSSHSFTNLGDNKVVLRVKDDSGNIKTLSKTVKVGNRPPNVKFFYSPTPTPDPSVVTRFDAAASNDVDGSITSYRWDFRNDGSLDGNGVTFTNDFSSSSIGTVREVKLTLEDDQGATNSTVKDVPVVKYIKEGGGQVPEVFVDAEAIKPSNNLCIGANCNYLTGQGPTSFEVDDEWVDLSGDKMSGSLKTERVNYSSSICIGEGCMENTDSGDRHLNSVENEMEGVLFTKSLTTDSELCISDESC